MERTIVTEPYHNGTLVSFLYDDESSLSSNLPVRIQSGGQKHVFVPINSIIRFVAELVRKRKIGELESKSDLEILGL